MLRSRGAAKRSELRDGRLADVFARRSGHGHDFLTVLFPFVVIVVFAAQRALALWPALASPRIRGGTNHESRMHSHDTSGSGVKKWVFLFVHYILIGREPEGIARGDEKTKNHGLMYNAGLDTLVCCMERIEQGRGSILI